MTHPAPQPAPPEDAGFDFVVLLTKLGSAAAAVLDDEPVYRPYALAA